MAIQTQDNRYEGGRGTTVEELEVVTDLSDELIVSEAEIDLLESFLSDLVTEMLNQPDPASGQR